MLLATLQRKLEALDGFEEHDQRLIRKHQAAAEAEASKGPCARILRA